MITEQQKQGVVEILAHFYNSRFIQKLTDLKHKELLEQLETMFYTAQTEQFDDLVICLVDTINQCVKKPLSSKNMDLLLWHTFTPSEMHKTPPKSYKETINTSIPFIHKALVELCVSHKIPTIKLFVEDYSMLTTAIQEGINESHQGYFAPVDSIKLELKNAKLKIKSLKKKVKDQSDYIEVIEQQIKEFEKLQLQNTTQVAPTVHSQSEDQKNDGALLDPTDHHTSVKQSKRTTRQTKTRTKTQDVSFLHGQAQQEVLQ